MDEFNTPSRLSGQIELNDLSFGFTAIQPPLIDGLSLMVHPGMRVALLGKRQWQKHLGQVVSWLVSAN